MARYLITIYLYLVYKPAFLIVIFDFKVYFLVYLSLPNRTLVYTWRRLHLR